MLHLKNVPWPLKHTSHSSSLQFHRQRGDEPGVHLSARNIRKIIITSLYTFGFFLPRLLMKSDMSMGVIRGVGLTSQLTRQRKEPRGTGGED